MASDIFDNLNKQQKEAVRYSDGPSVILAGAGSGKTRVLVHKVLYFIEEKKIDPRHILMITFTNKAASEMKKRISVMLAGHDTGSIGYVGTFHSFCALMLRRDGEAIGIDRNFVIYDEQDQTALMKTVVKKLSMEKSTPSYYLYRISAAKNHLISPETYLTTFSDHRSAQVAQVYESYQKALKKNNALDFDDLLVKAVELLSDDIIRRKYNNRYTHILVDEFQDTNQAQYALTKLLAGQSHNVTVVGDFSQSIYSWRGADIKNLEAFQEYFPESKVFYLEENYRSTQSILNFAYDVISQNQTHPVLQLHTNNKQGEEITYYEAQNEQDEAMYVALDIERKKNNLSYSDFSVLYRTNAQSRVIEEAFLHAGIPYVLIGGTRFYERKEVKDVLSYLRLFVNPLDEIALERVKKIGKRKWDQFKKLHAELNDGYKETPVSELMEMVFEKTGYLGAYNPNVEEDYERLENIKELKSVAVSFPNLVQFLEQVALVESEYSAGEKAHKGYDGVRLMTLHQAKGLEFRYVYIVGVEEGILPHVRSLDDLHSLEEERRLFYVGITRSREKLTVTYTKRRFIFGRRGEVMKSRFIGGTLSDYVV